VGVKGPGDRSARAVSRARDLCKHSRKVRMFGSRFTLLAHYLERRFRGPSSDPLKGQRLVLY
jgi:hypothetical protein